MTHLGEVSEGRRGRSPAIPAADAHKQKSEPFDSDSLHNFNELIEQGISSK